MNDLILVKKTRYANKCKECGETIPAESECYWEKNTKNNYHVECKPDDPKSSQQAKPLTPFNEEALKIAVEKQVSDNLSWALKEALTQLDTDLHTAKEKGYMGALVQLLIEAANEKHSLIMAEKIQQNKLNNMRVMK